MKKTLLLTIAATMVAGAAFASAVPVTDINAGQSKIAGEYSFGHHVTGVSGSNDGYGASLETGLSDRWAAQYAYHKTNVKHGHNGDIATHELGAIYKLNDNFNLYGEGTMVDYGPNNYGFQGGVIGHTQLADRVQGFAKVGFGDDIKQSYQIGATYDLKDNIGLNLYYGYDKYNMDDENVTDKGIHAGVGYKF